MKLFTISVFLAFLSGTALADSVGVPGIGSVWKSTTEYSDRSRDDYVEVKEMKNGLPVFSGRIHSFYGKIFETKAGILFYEDECKYNVPEDLFVPSDTPNQCGTSICIAPPIGETVKRGTIVFTRAVFCSKQEGAYIFRSKRMSTHNGEEVTVGEVTAEFMGRHMGTRDSYIKKGFGEVFGEDVGRATTTYSRVEVLHAPYSPPDDLTTGLREFGLTQ
jgi:hypothetical protein